MRTKNTTTIIFDSVPSARTAAAIARLDQFLNKQIISAANNAECARWWEHKLAAKVQFEHLDDHELAFAANELLAVLKAA